VAILTPLRLMSKLVPLAPVQERSAWPPSPGVCPRRHSEAASSLQRPPTASPEETPIPLSRQEARTRRVAYCLRTASYCAWLDRDSGGLSMFVTMVEGSVEATREDDLRSAWKEVTDAEFPPGFIESSLLRAEDGTWRIVTIWESKEAVMAIRASGEPPAAPIMFERAGSRPSVSMWTVEGRVRAS
jgi:heme-degrading monooxygenase HmoA